MSDPKTIRNRNHGDHGDMSRPLGLIAIGLLLLALATPHAATRGQAMVSSGHALDANLRLGSGGYNGAVRGPGRVMGSDFRRGVYDAYRGGIDRYNAFRDERAYTPHRWTGVNVQRGSDSGAGAAPTLAVGFGEAYDPGYEAGLADAEYESETAQQQANILSYGVGFGLGEEVRAILDADQVGLDRPSIITGFRDAVHDDPPRMSEAEMEEVLHALYERVMAERTGERLRTDPEFRAELERNEASGKLLHERLARDAEVVTLDNGLQYRVLVEGTGDMPTIDDKVSINLRLLTPEAGYVTEPMRRQIILRYSLEGAVIALTSMKVGSVWQIAIPSKLAHGANGRPPHYGPGMTLYYEVELLAIH